MNILLWVLQVLLAAAGLTLPGVTRILPWLVTWAAVGVMIVMISAAVHYLVRAEFMGTATTAALLAVAAFIAYARWRIAPIRPRRAAASPG